MTKKRNVIKRYNSISEFEKDTTNMNNYWYTIQCFSESNWRVIAAWVLININDKEDDEETNADSWWAS